jgi:hypothetical protein
MSGGGDGSRAEIQRLQAEILRMKLRSTTEDERVRRYVAEMENKRDRDLIAENDRLKADMMASLEDLKSINEQFLHSRSQLDFQQQLRHQERAQFESKMNDLQDELNQAAWMVESQNQKSSRTNNEQPQQDSADERQAQSQDFTAERARLRSKNSQLANQNRYGLLCCHHQVCV